MDADLPHEAKDDDRFEPAMTAAFDELARLRLRANGGNALPGDRSRELHLLDLIRSVSAILADARRREPEPETQSRVSDVHDGVLRALKREPKSRWTSSEIRSSLARQGVTAEPKSVTNCLDYLVRRKRLTRISRGLYHDPEYGIGIVSLDDDMGAEPGRYDFE